MYSMFNSPALMYSGDANPTTGLRPLRKGGYENQQIIYNPNTQQQGYMAGGKFYPIGASSNKPALPPAVNYTPSTQWQGQLARSNDMFNGLLGGQSALNMAPTRVAAKPGQTSSQNYTPASLSAQYLK